MADLAADVQAAVRRAEALGGEARAAAREVARALLAFHGEALRRLLAAVERGQPPTRDPLLAGLFELHGITPGDDLIPARRLAAAGRAARNDHLRCGLCGERLAADHGHLSPADGGKLLCACLACAVLFDGGDGRYRRIVSHARPLPGRPIDDAEWQALGVPVALAFFRVGAEGGVTAVFPGPAGASEAAVPPAAWSNLCSSHPDLGALAPEVEALLVDRRAPPPRQVLASIDHGYRLVGVVRSSWQGSSGGPGVDQALTAFFEGLR